MQNVLKPRFRPIILSYWQMQKKAENFLRLVRGGYYTALSFDIIHDVFVLFTFVKVGVIWFDTLVSNQS